MKKNEIKYVYISETDDVVKRLITTRNLSKFDEHS